MKKMISSGLVLSVLVAIILASCATVPVSKTAITKGDLSLLKGKWSGSRTTFSGHGGPTEMEITNDSIPLRGRFLIYAALVKRSMDGGGPLNFNNGQINSAGNLIIKDQQNEFELSLYKTGGKMKLEGDYFFMGFRGRLSLEKE